MEQERLQPHNRARRRIVALALGLVAAPLRAEVAYPDVQAGTALDFPRDEGAHPAYRSEWWYVTGWLRDAQGADCGFQMTFFLNQTGVAG